MIVTARIRQEMAKVRSDSIATGMRSALAVVLDYCNKEDLFPEEKIAEIQKFCEKGLNKKDQKVAVVKMQLAYELQANIACFKRNF